MPQKLQHPPALRIAHLCIHNPLPEPLVIAQRPRPHLIPRDSELGTARGPHQRRRLRPGPLLLLRTRARKHVGPHVRRHVRVAPVRLQAARVPVAAQVDVAVALHDGDPEGPQGVDVVVERRVSVPGGEEAGAVGVEEDEGGGQVGVVIDDVGEVGHGFSAFVHGARESCVGGVGGGGVDAVDGRLPAVLKLYISKHRQAGMMLREREPVHTRASVALPSPCYPSPSWP